VQTIKRADRRNEVVLNRDEWENDIQSDLPDLNSVKGTALEPLLSKKLCRALKPVFETRVQRTIYPIKGGKSEIEVSIDKGLITARGRSTQVNEIELELKR
jgi:triphosphatase